MVKSLPENAEHDARKSIIGKVGAATQRLFTAASISTVMLLPACNSAPEPSGQTEVVKKSEDELLIERTQAVLDLEYKNLNEEQREEIRVLLQELSDQKNGLVEAHDMFFTPESRSPFKDRAEKMLVCIGLVSEKLHENKISLFVESSD